MKMLNYLFLNELIIVNTNKQYYKRKGVVTLNYQQFITANKLLSYTSVSLTSTI